MYATVTKHDNIGNRKTVQEKADDIAYRVNELNQYTSITENGKTPFAPQFDAAGNQTLLKTATGVWTVIYNAENRPVSFTGHDGNTVVECGYDDQGRRCMKKVTVNGTVTSHERYLYRGYLQIAALDMLNGRNVLRTILWGSDGTGSDKTAGAGAGQCPLLLWNRLQQERHGGVRRAGDYRCCLRLLTVRNSYSY